MKGSTDGQLLRGNLRVGGFLLKARQGDQMSRVGMKNFIRYQRCEEFLLRRVGLGKLKTKLKTEA